MCAATSAESALLLEARELRVILGGHRILAGLDLDIKVQSVHALLGPNGCGKSSLAYTIMGCAGYVAETGSITFAGERIDAQPLHERARRGNALAWLGRSRLDLKDCRWPTT